MSQLVKVKKATEVLEKQKGAQVFGLDSLGVAFAFGAESLRPNPSGAIF